MPSTVRTASIARALTRRGIAFKALLRDAAAYPGHWQRRHFGSGDSDDQTPLRAELFSADQMEQHGKALAATHTLSRSGTRDRLLKRLGENEQILIEACRLLTTAVKAKHRIAPAGEWLLDNFYLIEEQIRVAREHLPSGYSRELPRLAQGPSAGLPRVYDLHWKPSPTATAASTRKHWPVSWRLTRPSHRSRWASCGPFRSCCAWH